MRCTQMVWITTLCLVSLSQNPAHCTTRLDSLRREYAVAAQQWDSAGLAELHSRLSRSGAGPQIQELAGIVAWRVQLIAWCRNNSAEIRKYGPRAIDALKAARSAGADEYQTSVYEALASQLMAGLGVTSGATYGPRIGALISTLKKSRPEAYFTRLIDAVNLLEAPSFAGGNPSEAVQGLSRLSRAYPDSLDPAIHHARALIKVGKRGEARTIIDRILSVQPGNLFALKTARELEKRS